MIVFINFLGFFGIKQTDIYLQRLRDAQLQVDGEKNENEIEDKSSISSTHLTNEFKQELYERALKLLKEEKLYLDPALTILSLAKQLNVNYKYISIAINDITKNNFYNLINDLRIEEAIENMKKHGERMTLDAIANMSGFRSRSTFNNAFKRKMGMNPSEYLKSYFSVNQ